MLTPLTVLPAVALSSILALFPPALAAHASMLQPLQSTGMGVVLKDPTPRDSDPIDIFHNNSAAVSPVQPKMSERQLQILGECNQILLLAHELHVKLLEHDTSPALPSNDIMTQKIAKLAKKVQQDMKGQ